MLRVAGCNYVLRSINSRLLWGIVANCFGLLGFPSLSTRGIEGRLTGPLANYPQQACSSVKHPWPLSALHKPTLAISSKLGQTTKST